MNSINAFLIAIICGLVAYGLSGLSGDQGITPRVLLSVSLMFWTFTLAIVMFNKREHFVMICVALFNIFGLILPAMFQTASGYFPWMSAAYPADLERRAAVVLLAYSIMTQVGYLVISPRFRLSRHEGELRTELDLRLAIWGVFALAIIAVVGVYAIGIQYFMAERRLISRLLSVAGGSSPMFLIAQTIVRDMGFFSLALIVALFASRRTSYLVLVPISLVALAAFLFSNNPLNVARFNLFAFVIALLPLYFSTEKPTFKLSFVGAYVLGMLVLMPILNTLTRGAAGTELSTDFFSVYRSTVDFDGFQSMMNVIMWIDSQGLNWGHQLVSAVLFFVPQDIWAGKGVATGIEGALFMRYPITNISAPLPIEIYADFGLAGVFCMSLIFGVLLARLDSRMERSGRTGGTLAKLPFALLAGYSAILIRGPLLGVLGPTAAAFVLSIVVARLFSSRQRWKKVLSEKLV